MGWSRDLTNVIRKVADKDVIVGHPVRRMHVDMGSLVPNRTNVPLLDAFPRLGTLGTRD